MSVRRVCVHSERDDGSVALDVLLPCDAPVGDLLPAIVDMVDDRHGSRLAVTGWRLDRLTGGALTESLSLITNGIRDGDVLVLAHLDAPVLGPLPMEPCLQVAVGEPAVGDAARYLPGAACVVTSVAAALALVWTGVVVDPIPALVVAGLGTGTAVATSLARGHSTPVAVAAVALAAATGYLAVPSGSSTANGFLAATAALSTSLLLLRLARRASTSIVAIGSLATLIAVVTIASVPVAAIGAGLSTAALGLLALSPRLTVLATGLGPAGWTAGLTDRATAAHVTLTGIVTGSAVGGAAGAALLAIAELLAGGPTYGSVALAGLIAVVLLLRARTYVDASRRTALVASGMASGVACFALVVVKCEGSASWLCGLVVAIGLTAVARPRCGVALSHAIDRLEYAALAAVVPIACWVGGVYELVRGVHPT